MSKPQRLQLSRRKGFDLQAWSRQLNGLAAVNVARPSPWGNPFIVGLDGDPDYCVLAYRRLLEGEFNYAASAPRADQVEARRHAIAHIGELTGKNLACWCRGDMRCHADVLLAFANAVSAPPALAHGKNASEQGGASV